ncbi:putative conjugative transfer protein [Orientia tsutsugamushi str. Gilliam]|uniref:Putative conjugative transfer protein n=1 Tax=Orientia tsutsugamushi str. Gilliam TaxID=1359184 RepID=A0A0F3M929_ORITS|nr:putative conjugative transfer protein [Orientia tsutsugamushi str. Gilliam]
MTGWGRDIGLSQCKSKEQELALYRKKVTATILEPTVLQEFRY